MFQWITPTVGRGSGWIVSFHICGSFKHSMGTERIDKQTIWKCIWHRYQDKTKIPTPEHSITFGAVPSDSVIIGTGPNHSTIFDTVPKISSRRNFGECGVPLYCHRSQVHSDPEVAPDKSPIYGLNRTKPWFLDSFFAFKLHIYAELNCLK